MEKEKLRSQEGVLITREAPLGPGRSGLMQEGGSCQKVMHPDEEGPLKYLKRSRALRSKVVQGTEPETEMNEVR